jgi:hypothetical protein
MAKYCLTFDAKDAVSWDPEELKLKISGILLENKGLYLENPLASVILFEDGNVHSDIHHWNTILLRQLKEDVYYYLCVVAKSGKGDFIDRNEGDPDMDADYQDLLEDLEE